MKYVYISTGEASGDLYGGHLLSSLKEITPELQVKAMGGDLLKQAGADIIQPIKELQLIGTFELIPELFNVYKTLRKLKRFFFANPPSLAILIDFPDFHFNIGAFLKKLCVPIVYYVSPQIWAWRSSRIHTIKNLVDLMIPLYEFENRMYQEAGIPTFHSGHPLLDIVSTQLTKNEFFSKYAISDNKFILGILPGSRTTELHYHIPTLLAIMRQLKLSNDLTFLIIKAPTLPDNLLTPFANEGAIIINEDKYEAMSFSHLLLVASGTATVEACITETPMIVFYKVNPLSWFFGRWLVKTKSLSMVNIFAEEHIVPEYYQPVFKARPIAEHISKMIEQPSLLAQQKSELQRIKTKLGKPYATRKIAEFLSSHFLGKE
ncbi:MAG: lipid-A-disaccharide synthase [Candidatus Fischerbacteria bacterium RBG_13_37_8]|uniref:Lipid-A-disaccharide synthase n=1 Tax=Candidatus Fischerbacteria bacterium RBG_13_37_8 TaxID=1817863 RepID=A0A1F5V4N0_9BACT|nr:MAG: lipid-A-disaccharide synthase [Candidatus Fischerbacteria bacterium RBG_13_37_8]